MGKATAGKRKQRQAKVKSPLPKDHIGPTPEQMAKFNFKVTSPTTSAGAKMGRAYRREPHFESLVTREWTAAQREKRDAAFSVEDLQALRVYREVYEGAERSDTKCALASMVHGSGGGDGPTPPATVRARAMLRSIEGLLGAHLPTMRAVAILDQSYAQVAMARFGSRNLDVYDDASGTFVSKPAPRSGRHAMRISDEFRAGVKVLTSAVQGMFGK